jgi:protein-S-isoprenylcysteine O-methyltransferase Ste14
MLSDSEKRFFGRILSGGGIVAYFIIAAEFIIMISPFAFFFYSVFNPLFQFLASTPPTRWLVAFFLPHMAFPPSLFLEGVRVAGSVMFVGGALMFLVPAAQVYLGKLLKSGMASRGVYQVLRHPQYVGLAVCGAGMSILWPRFLTLVSLWVMVILYYLLARDEERRMTEQHGDGYEEYMRRTGMFLPRRIEEPLASAAARLVPTGWGGAVAVLAVGAVLLGGGFGLRALTVAQLPMETKDGVTLVSILPEDNGYLGGAVTALADKGQRLGGGLVLRPGESHLGYLMPVDYVMQGMIADTGLPWHLYKQHHTLAMIADWVVHPFRHLRQPPVPIAQVAAGQDPAKARRKLCPLGIDDPALDCARCPYRRVVLVRVETDRGQENPRALFSATARRAAAGYLDMDVRSGAVVDAVGTQGTTAWQDVPTPVF